MIQCENKILNKKKKWIIGFLCSIPVLAIAFLIISWTGPYNKIWNQEQIYILSEREESDASSKQVANDRTNRYKEVAYEDFLEEMRLQGELMTSNEFASRITSYYNTLVSVLGIIFTLTSFAALFLGGRFFKNEYEGEKLRNIGELDRDFSEKVSRMLRDSIGVRSAITTSIRGEIEGDFARVDDIETLIRRQENISNKLKDIERQLADLQEICPASLMVVEDADEELENRKNNED